MQSPMRRGSRKGNAIYYAVLYARQSIFTVYKEKLRVVSKRDAILKEFGAELSLQKLVFREIETFKTLLE
jgi:hypothetical protein